MYNSRNTHLTPHRPFQIIRLLCISTEQHVVRVLFSQQILMCAFSDINKCYILYKQTHTHMRMYIIVSDIFHEQHLHKMLYHNSPTNKSASLFSTQLYSVFCPMILYECFYFYFYFSQFVVKRQLHIIYIQAHPHTLICIML